MAQRIKGQEVSIAIIKDNQLQTRIDTISDMTVEFMLEVLEEGYLGKVANDFDSIYNGMSVEISGHMTNSQALDFAEAIVGRAQRRTTGASRIDIAGTFAFPNGENPTLALPDVYFESVPFETGGREEYVSFKLSGKCSTFNRI